MNITRNLLHEWYHGGARTPADVQRLAQENLGLTLTAEKVKKILEDQIPLEQWYQTRIMAAIPQRRRVCRPAQHRRQQRARPH